MKRAIQIAFIIIITISLVGCSCEKVEKKETTKRKTKEKFNIASDIIKEQLIDEILISNVSLKIDNGMHIFSADITNKSENIKTIETFDIVIKDKDNQVITTLLGYVGKQMQKDETQTVTAMTDTDLSKAEIVEYKFTKKD